MKLPKLSYLQHLVLNDIRSFEKTGKQLRKSIEWDKSNAAFSKLMERIEKNRYVIKDYVKPENNNPNSTRECLYKITRNGTIDLNQSRAFYRIPKK